MEIIYEDENSIFIDMKIADPEEALKRAEELSKELTILLQSQPPLKMEFEKHLADQLPYRPLYKSYHRAQTSFVTPPVLAQSVCQHGQGSKFMKKKNTPIIEDID